MLIVSELKKEEINQIVDIEKTLYKNPWKEKDYTYELTQNPFAYYFTIKIKETNEIIGYIGFWIKFEYAEITKISIKKEYQGRKLSIILMEDMLKRIKLANCVNVTLEVRVSNIKAINLYKKFGFEIVSTRKKYYDNKEDAYLMLKEV